MAENLPDTQEDVNTLHKNELITSKATVKLSASTMSVCTKTPGNRDLKEPLQGLKSLKKKFTPLVEIKSDKETPL